MSIAQYKTKANARHKKLVKQDTSNADYLSELWQFYAGHGNDHQVGIIKTYLWLSASVIAFLAAYKNMGYDCESNLKLIAWCSAMATAFGVIILGIVGMSSHDRGLLMRWQCVLCLICTACVMVVIV